jgi:hypothetical protein
MNLLYNNIKLNIMGYYINKTSKGIALPQSDKADYLILDGATEIFGEDIKYQPNLICVVKNNNQLGAFEAAGYCYSPEEFIVFNDPRDQRPKKWLIHPAAAMLAA